MKLVHPEIENVFHFGNGNFPSLIIENPAFFHQIVSDFFNQSQGGSGKAILAVDDMLLPFAGNVDLLIDFFSFEINKKILLNKILTKLEKQALEPEFYSRGQLLISQVENFVYDLAFEHDVDIELSRLTIGSLLKSCGINLKDNFSSLPEKLLHYMELMTNNNLANIFILVNLRTLISYDSLELFTKTCSAQGYNIFLIDNNAERKLSKEKRIVIDSDLCEI